MTFIGTFLKEVCVGGRCERGPVMVAGTETGLKQVNFAHYS